MINKLYDIFWEKLKQGLLDTHINWGILQDTHINWGILQDTHINWGYNNPIGGMMSQAIPSINYR